MSGAKDTKSALVLLSGGLDSATCLAIAKLENDHVEAFFLDYGQAYRKELDHAKIIAKHYKTKLHVRTVSQLEQIKDYFPFRNLIIFSMAAHFAEIYKIYKIYHGANAEDIYPDNAQKFLEGFTSLCRKMKSDVQLKCPLINMNTAEIIRTAKTLDVPINSTWSCYENYDLPCGVCQACIRKHNAFEQLKVRSYL